MSDTTTSPTGDPGATAKKKRKMPQMPAVNVKAALPGIGIAVGVIAVGVAMFMFKEYLLTALEIVGPIGALVLLIVYRKVIIENIVGIGKFLLQGSPIFAALAFAFICAISLVNSHTYDPKICFGTLIAIVAALLGGVGLSHLISQKVG